VYFFEKLLHLVTCYVFRVTVFCLAPHSQVKAVPFFNSPDYLAFSYVIPIPVGRLFIHKFCDDMVLTDLDFGVRRISFIAGVCELYLKYPTTFQKYVYRS